jgi:hypothetical protein
VTFPQYLTVATQHAVTTASISQIHANRDGFLSTFRLHRSLLAWLGTATLLHGRLLCTSSALPGAYRIPSEPAFSFHLGESSIRIPFVKSASIPRFGMAVSDVERVSSKPLARRTLRVGKGSGGG